VIIFFWLGVFLACFTIIPIIIVFIYKRAKQLTDAGSG